MEKPLVPALALRPALGICIMECPICCDLLEGSSDACATKCGHLFHQDCLATWLRQKPECPSCKGRLGRPERDVIRLFLPEAPEDGSGVGDGGLGGGGEGEGGEGGGGERAARRAEIQASRIALLDGELHRLREERQRAAQGECAAQGELQRLRTEAKAALDRAADSEKLLSHVRCGYEREQRTNRELEQQSQEWGREKAQLQALRALTEGAQYDPRKHNPEQLKWSHNQLKQTNEGLKQQVATLRAALGTAGARAKARKEQRSRKPERTAASSAPSAPPRAAAAPKSASVAQEAAASHDRADGGAAPKARAAQVIPRHDRERAKRKNPFGAPGHSFAPRTFASKGSSASREPNALVPRRGRFLNKGPDGLGGMATAAVRQ